MIIKSFTRAFGDELHPVGPLGDLLNHLNRTRAVFMSPTLINPRVRTDLVLASDVPNGKALILSSQR